MGQSLENLSMQQRAAHYRQLAEDALELSQNSTSDEQRTFFLTLANGWHSLAAEIERQCEALPHLRALAGTKLKGERRPR